ncbi:hypothetical protein HDU82_008417 [Entophlyctis luteolus]|nr:hypothetical protein HDU82_008417 [Entophlyctis luteolus]
MIHRLNSVASTSDSMPMYACAQMAEAATTTTMPEGPMDPRVAKQLISDKLSLDGNPKLNMASFVTTFMDPEAEELMMDGLRKNFIDLDEYEQTADLHNACVAMIADLFNAPPTPKGVPHPGTGTIGSSEAIMLSVLAMKWKWRKERLARGLSIDKPNLVCGSNVQVCWHKACRYFDVECREADVSPDALVLTAERAKPLIDENTIGVSAILGSTFNGEFEDVHSIHDMVVALNEEKGWSVPVHVDAASGGFIAPFTDPDLLWDFRLPNVKSINVSGHKFGLVYAGIGWALWREPQDLPEELVFHVNYLGGDQASFTLNFSKGASTVIGQYYNLIRFGKSGYRDIMSVGMENAAYLRSQIEAMGIFDIVDKQHMPLVAFALKDASKYTVFDLQDRMKHEGWIIPAYTCSKGAEGLAIMRVVVKQNFSRELADLLVGHLKHSVKFLEHLVEKKLVPVTFPKPKKLMLAIKNSVLLKHAMKLIIILHSRHWVERDCFVWAKAYLTAQLGSLSAIREGGEAPVFVVTSIASVEGQADLHVRKGRLITVFDLTVVLTWKGADGAGAPACGQVSIIDFMHDTDVDKDLEVVIAVDDKSQQVSASKQLKMHLLPKVKQVLAQFAERMIEENSKNLNTNPVEKKQPAQSDAKTAASSSFAFVTSAKQKHFEQQAARTAEISLQTHFACTASDIYDTLLNPARVKVWSFDNRVEIESIEVGKPYSLFGGSVKGVFCELSPCDKITMTWRLNSWPVSQKPSIVHITIQEYDNACEVSVKQQGIPADEADIIKRNWEAYYFAPIRNNLEFSFQYVGLKELIRFNFTGKWHPFQR